MQSELYFKNEQEILCKICYEKISEILILPCGHLTCCFGCFKESRSSKCFVCREKILSHVTVKSELQNLFSLEKEKRNMFSSK